MTSALLERLFPNLQGSSYHITSPRAPGYNCIAWAAGDERRWWWPAPDDLGGYYWPPELPREETLESFVLAFSLLGYTLSDDPELEPGFERVAIYAGADGTPTHAARQLESGAWSSKLGQLEDIEHATLAALTGETYGEVARILKRLR